MPTTMPDGRSYLQPHEGVNPEQRKKDPILSSPANSILIGRLAQELKKTRLMAGREFYPAYERMIKPEIGDLVVITDQIRRKNQPDAEMHKAVGYLVARREEWWSKDASWEQSKLNDPFLTDEMRMVEPDAIYIQYGYHHVCRWVNCEVIRVE